MNVESAYAEAHYTHCPIHLGERKTQSYYHCIIDDERRSTERDTVRT